MDVGLTVGGFIVWYVLAGFMLAATVHFTAAIVGVAKSFISDALAGK